MNCVRVENLSPRTRAPQGATDSPRATRTYKGTDLDLTAFEDAMTSVRDQKWSDAQAKLEKFMDEFPKSTYRFRVRYALALVYMKNGKKDQSNKTFQDIQNDSPLTFYGLASALAEGKDFEENISKEAPMAAVRDIEIAPEDLFRINRAELLLAQGAAELASFELRVFRSPHYSSSFLMYLRFWITVHRTFQARFRFFLNSSSAGIPGSPRNSV